MKRARNGYNGAVSCAATTTRETGLFAKRMKIHEGEADYSVSGIGGDDGPRCGSPIVDRSSSPGIGPVVDGTRACDS